MKAPWPVPLVSFARLLALTLGLGTVLSAACASSDEVSCERNSDCQLAYCLEGTCRQDCVDSALDCPRGYACSAIGKCEFDGPGGSGGTDSAGSGGTTVTAGSGGTKGGAAGGPGGSGGKAGSSGTSGQAGAQGGTGGSGSGGSTGGDGGAAGLSGSSGQSGAAGTGS